MKCIVVLGAGKSSIALIEYLNELSQSLGWAVYVADKNPETAQQKTGTHPHVHPIAADISDEAQRDRLISLADVVISLLPPAFHILVAKSCIQLGKHLLTASYIDDQIRSLESDIQNKGLLFLCEMGLDPGIDHMSAMQMIHRIQQKGGTITSFRSHCGGLVAPESDDNPWHYKVSWNPQNVVMAGKGGAVYKENNEEIKVLYEDLFTPFNNVEIPGVGLYSWYANRDSLRYAHTYGLEQAATFVRTTLRHPEFCFGWNNLIDLQLTSETLYYDTDNLTVAEFFKQHFYENGFGSWLNQMLLSRLNYAKDLMDSLDQLVQAENMIKEAGIEEPDHIMLVDAMGKLNKLDVEEEKNNAAQAAAAKMHEANVILTQLFYLGLEDETLINKGRCSAVAVLQFIVENKLMLQPEDKDMVIMLHQIEYTNAEGEAETANSCLVLKGQNSSHTAMAKTVGLPLGIAAKLLLQGQLNERGLHIPIVPTIYEPVLSELAKHGIQFTEV